MHGRGFTLHNCDANIYFNHKCVYNNAIPSYISIQVSNTPPVSKFTQKRTQILRIKRTSSSQFSLFCLLHCRLIHLNVICTALIFLALVSY